MKTNLKHFLPYLLVTVLAVTLIISMTSCSSPSTPTPSATVPVASQPNASAPAQSSVPGSVPRQGAGANGTLAKIDGNLLTLNTPQGQTMVNVTSSTAIQKTVAGTLSDLQTGQVLTVTGNADASGNIAANSISIRSQDQNTRFVPPTGATPTPAGRPNRPGGTSGARPNNGGPGNGTFGTLAKIDGNTLTLTTGQGQSIIVTVSSSTTFQKTVSGAIVDFQVGESLTVMGTPDAQGNLNAISVTIRPGVASLSGT